jgi:hypothetical protein
MNDKKDSFSIERSQKRNTAQATQVDEFVSGSEPETTKTFRLPVRLSRALRIHAAQIGQTEKEILTRLIEEYLQENR